MRALAVAALLGAVSCAPGEARPQAPASGEPAAQEEASAGMSGPASAEPARQAAREGQAAGGEQAAAPAVSEVEPASPAAEPATSVKQGAGGRCEPTPRQGDPCLPGDGYCVLSWGEPGGHSEALWCRGGRWEREQEVNLPR